MEKRKSEDGRNTQTRDLLHDVDSTEELSESFVHIKNDEERVDDEKNPEEGKDEQV